MTNPACGNHSNPTMTCDMPIPESVSFVYFILASVAAGVVAQLAATTPNAGTVTATIQAAPSTSTLAASAGTLTTTWAATANGNSVDITNYADSSLSETTLKCSYQLRINTDGAGVVTP